MTKPSKRKPSRRSKESSKRSSEKTETDEPKRVVDEEVTIVDELAEVESQDPTFAGFRPGPKVEEIHERIVEALRDLHYKRFRHNAPADPVKLFEGLVDEMTLPNEALIGEFLSTFKTHGRVGHELLGKLEKESEKFFTRIEEL